MKRNGPVFLIGLGIACLIVFYLWQTTVYHSQRREVVLIQPIKREVFTAPKDVKRDWRSYLMAVIIATGAGDTDANGTWTDNGTSGGRAAWIQVISEYELTSADSSTTWEIRQPGGTLRYKASGVNAKPPATGWVAQGATPSPGPTLSGDVDPGVANTKRSFIVN